MEEVMTSTLEIGDWGVWRASHPRTVQVEGGLIVDLTNVSEAAVSFEDLRRVLADLIVDRSWGMHQ
jgi:hypothetical protein